MHKVTPPCHPMLPALPPTTPCITIPYITYEFMTFCIVEVAEDKADDPSIDRVVGCGALGVVK